MIPAADITAWGLRRPWITRDQVEQDLLLERVIVEIAQDPYLGGARPPNTTHGHDTTVALTSRHGGCDCLAHDQRLRPVHMLEYVRSNRGV